MKDKMYKQRIKIAKRTNAFKEVEKDSNIYHKEFIAENKKN